MKHFSNLYKGNLMHKSISDNQKLIIERNYIEQSKKLSYEFIKEKKDFQHILVFCGKGVSQTLCDQINQLSELLNEKVFIGITDRGDLQKFKFHKSIHIIPMCCNEDQIPIGYMSENFLFCELKSIYKYVLKLQNNKYKYFTRLRKDVFLLIENFINYLQCVPSLNKKYSFITTEESTNLMRRFCLSDQFFTIPFQLINSIPYRIRPNRKRNFWWDCRHIKPQEIFKNNHQMEQWVWVNFLNSFSFNLNKNCTFEEYIDYLDRNILVLPPKQIGYLWNRSSDVYLHNLVRFPPFGRGLFISTKPLRNYTSYSSFISPLILKQDSIAFFKLIRFLIFSKKLLRFLFTLPLYYLRYLIQNR